MPLPRRGVSDASHQIALLIRDGRKVAQQLASIAEPSKTSLSSRETFSRLSGTETSMSTVALEQDFTVEGKKGSLECPFSAPQPPSQVGGEAECEAASKPARHEPSDPICAAMAEDATSLHAPAGTSKCPIRYLDKHSPEEIAHYVKTHKHELPRSHAVCVERYQRSEEQIRKLDAKYGNIVTMIEGLGQLHKPMLPVSEDPPEDGVVNDASNQRVENWAQDVSAKTNEPPAGAELPDRIKDNDALSDEEAQEPGRESHFDRPLKEIRVGESPTRPWGISVPVYDAHENGDHPPSPPPAPVLMPTDSVHNARGPPSASKRGGKCPFDHTKLAGLDGLGLSQPAPDDGKPSETSHKPATARPRSSQKHEANAHPPSSARPAFLNMPQLGQPGIGNAPQMLFTGPVFIGYPMDQAIQFMNAFQGR